MTDLSHTPPPPTEPTLGLGLDPIRAAGPSPASAQGAGQAAYRVLARKYRPVDFSGLIGQEALVRTLSNAIESGRIAHAFILTGVRGVGKTTTARIIARALNCIGPDGTGGPTIQPCGQCDPCIAISESRHVDVLEMDAASHTGIGDVREIIDAVRYLPASARTKVYIIDEVHMLSNAAFNGLLKTLEEPPPHVVFVFATTEIRKVPVTVLSRCQRFDLRRVEIAELIDHLARIAREEGVEAAPEALAVIARAAEGSVRDALSILDQAIAHAAGAGEASGRVEAEAVRAMLGLADRTRVLDLFEAAMRGDIPGALAELRDQYAGGADPVAILQDLLDLTHWITRVKLVPGAGDDAAVPEEVRARGRANAEQLTVPVLTRTWQMLLKGLSEARDSQQPLACAEMALIRLAYAADLPSPADLVRSLRDGGQGGAAGAGAGPALSGGAGPGGFGGGAGNLTGATGPAAPAAPRAAPGFDPRAPMPERLQSGPGGSGGASASALPAAAPRPQPEPAQLAPASVPPAPIAVPDFPALLALAGAKRDLKLKAQLEAGLHLVRFEDGRIEFRPAAGAPPNLANQLSERLAEWTGRRWIVTVSNAEGAPTVAQQEARREAGLRERVLRDPTVAAVLAAFPGAEILNIRDLAPAPLPLASDAEDTEFTEDTEFGDGHPDL